MQIDIHMLKKSDIYIYLHDYKMSTVDCLLYYICILNNNWMHSCVGVLYE